MAQFIQRAHQDQSAIRDELIAGLQMAQATTSPKYLYDALGSRLFEAICELPEYYPTRTESAIFEQYADQIAESVGIGRTMIDLGAGNCAKAARLFGVLQPAHYVPVDISVDFLRDAVSNLQQRFPAIQMTGLGVDFSAPFALPDNVGPAERFFFYPGSSIGNFTPTEARVFLHRLALQCGDDGGMLIGVDLVNQPGLALDPQIAAKIIVKGMLSGWFTGRKLSDYITPSKADFIAARAIVNGSDRAGLIAGYALVFLEALKAASAEAPMAPEPGTPFPQHLPPQPPAAPSAPVGGKIIIPLPTARKFDLWAMLAELFAAIVKLFSRKV